MTQLAPGSLIVVIHQYHLHLYLLLYVTNLSVHWLAGVISEFYARWRAVNFAWTFFQKQTSQLLWLSVTKKHNSCLKLSHFYLMGISMLWMEDDMCVPTVSSVLGISLSKVCKVVFSPCLWIDKCICKRKCRHYTLLELTLAKPALTKSAKTQILAKFFLWDGQKQKCCKKKKLWPTSSSTEQT